MLLKSATIAALIAVGSDETADPQPWHAAERRTAAITIFLLREEVDKVDGEENLVAPLRGLGRQAPMARANLDA